MERTFVDTPSGQLLATQHIVLLGIEGSGVEEETRHAVLASLVTGERHLLGSFQGADSAREAQTYLDALLARMGAQRLGPAPSGTNGR